MRGSGVQFIKVMVPAPRASAHFVARGNRTVAPLGFGLSTQSMQVVPNVTYGVSIDLYLCR